MITEIFKEFTFEAAHYLPNVPAGHKCARVHGHSYVVVVNLKGEVDPVLGWVVDFGTIKEAFTPIIKRLDHFLLNDVEGLSNPTCENLAFWIWHHLLHALPTLTAVTVRETTTSGCTYRGE